MLQKFKSFKKYLSFFEKIDRKYFLIILALTILTVFLETLSIGLIIPVLQLILSDETTTKTINFFNSKNIFELKKSDLLILSLIFLGSVYTLKAIFLTAFSFLENKLLSKIKVRLSKKLFSIYLRKPYSFHQKTNSSELVRNLIDLKRFSAVMTAGSILMTEVLVFICVVSLLFFYEPLGTIGSLALFLTFGILFYFKIQKNAREWGTIRQKHQAYQIKNMNDCFQSIKEIKIFGKENYFIKNFTENSEKEIDAELNKHGFINSLPRYWFEWVTVLGMILLLLILFYFNKYTTDKIIPIMGLFGAAAFRLVPSIVRIMNTMQKIKYNLPVVEMVLNELERNKNENILIESKKIGIKGHEIGNFKKIYFKKINFRYDDSKKNIINNLTFEIEKGKIFGISGQSGIGKTTILNIITGLIKIKSGEILIDDKRIDENISILQKNIGYIPQRIFLLDDSIKNNVAFGEEEKNIDEEKILKLLNNVQLDKYLIENKKGLNTNIGEFGDKLSGGQIQRIGLARALYSSPKILVMDESTNALDAETEAKIFDELTKLKSSMTIILVAHRASVLNKCDKILNLS